MMTYKEFFYKAGAFLRRKLVASQRGKKWYFYMYPSYWHMCLRRNNNTQGDKYLASRPNPGAGIGHQMANWLSGHKMSKEYKVKYATYPFSYLNDPFVPNEWDSFLGLNNGETAAESLYKLHYKKVLLPLIDFQDEKQRNIHKSIINSYNGNTVFLLEMDQFAESELGDLEFLREKYYSSSARSTDKLIYKKEHFNVAVHIRRGDIVQTDPNHLNDNLTMRWLDMEYFYRLLEEYLPKYADERPIHLYLFSQAEKDELNGFERFGTVHFCNEMSAIDSFLHMVNADLLVMSKSGMSYQAAKLNKEGIILYPHDFWRERVESEKWIVV